MERKAAQMLGLALATYRKLDKINHRQSDHP
jgi:hypothetical protein